MLYDGCMSCFNIAIQILMSLVILLMVAVSLVIIYLYFFSPFLFLSFSLSFFYVIRHILSLSIADLILILTAVPFVSVIYTVESWPWGTRMCMLSEFMKDFSQGVSVFTLVAMSLDRFVAIVNPLRRFRGNGKFRKHLLA